MGFRFRKRIRIVSGLWLNASESGILASISGHGATLDVNRNGENHNASHDRRPSAVLCR